MVKYILSDLQFILDQILIAERHANGENLADIIPNSELSFGLRTVDGSFNHLVPGQSEFGSADNVFPRMLDPTFLAGETAIFGPPLPTHYSQTTGFVFDSTPRTISNLIVDQTPNNPAAVALAGSAGDDEIWGTADDVLNEGVSVVISPGLDGVAGDDPTTIGVDESLDDKLTFKFDNVTPDEGLSAPFNSWMTFFGQFFDHGLDLVTKGGSGTVFIPLKEDDPLYVEGSHTNFMVLTRATNQPGPDGKLGTADDIHEHTNTTSPFVDQNQTYSSHPSHQVFLRAYEARPLNIGTVEDPIIVQAPYATGGLLTSPEGGMATWGVLKAQARDLLGINLTDADVFNVPLLATDPYGNFIRGENGFPQVVMRTAGADLTFGTADDGTELVEGNPAAPISLDLAIRTGHAFLDDIAHDAAPSAGKTEDADEVAGINDGISTTYDDELLDAHYVAGDGRVNENIGLTAVHAVFHAEHNRLLEETKQVAFASGDIAFLNAWLDPNNQLDLAGPFPVSMDGLVWNGERLFQAAKFGTEMQYQHLVFEEFARTIQPNVDAFIDFNDTIDPSIVAEFAHTVYRFGHSMLTETVDRYDANFNANHIDLISAFLNPLEFAASGTTPELAAAAIIRGVTRDVGNEIDEFVTEALRNNLVGLPLDLAAINIARGRDTGVPSLNAARREFYNGTGDTQLKPYVSWVDFAMNIKHPESLVNFIAAYGTHALFSDARADTLAEKRAIATALVLGGSVTLTDAEGVEEEIAIDDNDRLDFLHSQGVYANFPNGVTKTGVDNIDFWIGGLAEAKMPFGGMLGSTFNFVFETQLEALQDADRFYYLHRLAGLNFFNELEANSFSSIVQKNAGVAHLPALIFSTPAYTLEADQSLQFTGLGPDGRADPTGDDPLVPLVSRVNLEDDGPLSYDNYLKYTGDDHVVLGGTNQNDILISSIGDDTVYGDGGNDRIEGGYGNDDLQGGDGDDIITDMGGDDVIKGGAGNDVIHGGNGLNLIIGGAGSDFIITGEDSSEAFAGEGNDFILAAKTDPVIVGNEGDDWIEGGLSDGAPGDTFDPFGNDLVAGNDVFIGDSAADETIGEGGDDIVIGTEGPDKYDGGSGFDWVTFKDDRFGVNVDLNNAAFNAAPLPVSVAAILTEFENNEGLSGSRHSDILRGNDDDAAGIAAAGTQGSVLTNIALINGLQALLDNAFGFSVSSFGTGNIILGGDGSDFIEGRGGDDIIHGDKWLNVRVSVRDAIDPSIEIDSVDRIAELVPRMLSGEINPGQLQIVREIVDGDGGFNFDTAVFSGSLADYSFTFDDRGTADLSDDLVIVSDSVVGRDGTDRLTGIERLQFADASITLPGFEGLNSDPLGLATITGTVASGQTLTASIAGVTDADNISATNLDGAITGAVAFYWQFEADPGTGVFEDIVNEAAGAPIPSRTLLITPDLEGLAIRVRAVYQDGHGVIESVVSAPTALVDVGAPPAPPAPAPDMTATADSEGVRYIRSDLQFILDSIKIAEAHAGGADLLSLVPNYRSSVGLRTVDGSYNNLTPGQEDFGAADRVFPRMTDPNYINPPGAGSYAQTGGMVVDAQPRVISNLIVDQTANNPAAYAAAYDLGADGLPGGIGEDADTLKDGVSVVMSPGLDGLFGTFDDVEVFQHNNTAPDEGLSAPFNSWMTFFGQFFDHGLDLVTKGGAGTVFVPLQPDDPLYVEGSPTNFMVLTRATNVFGPGEDGIMGTADDTRDNINTTSPFIDQNQTYSSHPSHQVFLREYHLVGDAPIATGKLIESRDLGDDGKFGTGDDGLGAGMATWAMVKAQARDVLGIDLTDADVTNVPLLATDQYGNFIKGPNGLPQVVMKGLDGIAGTADDELVEGNLAAPISLANAVRTGHAFLDDIAHTASPFTSTGVLKAEDLDDVAGGPVASGQYDNELLDAHYIAGDGRVNENIGLTAVHSVFHSEHNRLVQHTKDVVLATQDLAFLNEWLLSPLTEFPGPAEIDSLVWNGERLFQAAKFGTEMQYQHLVFEEFGRLIQPNIDVFLGAQINYDANIDPSIVAEFAHVVYRFGHSMLTETLNVMDENFVSSEVGLIAAFLNPLAFAEAGATPEQAVGAIVRGVTRDVGNEIDEFVTEALRNNLVGLPLDLATLNLARGRDTGMATLNQARRDFYEQTGDSNLKPYTSWADFVQHIKHPESLINFIAAYGIHAELNSSDVNTLAEKRAVAAALVLGGDAVIETTPGNFRTFTADDADRFAFLNSQGIYANVNGITTTGVDAIDFWIGGLAEEKMPFGGMLGSTFNFVFETQMEALQNADRFYYLDRTAGLNFLTELENNTFARMIAANSDAKHLSGNVFVTPGLFLEVDQLQQFNEGLGNLDPDSGDPLFPLVIRTNPTDPGDTNYLQYTGGDHVVLGGTDLGDDTLIGSIGDDTLWGDGGNDRLEGGYGNDMLFGGRGDDILTDKGGDDNIQGGDGNDVIQGGNGLDLLLGGHGNDFISTGEDLSEAFGGTGNDFLLGSTADELLLGNEGDDWIESGSADGAAGDNLDLNGLDLIAGNDVFIGDGMPNGMAGEGGDDIFVGSSGAGDRYDGASGFDWATFKDDRFGVNIDLNIRAFDLAPIPASAASILARFESVEGLSGSAHSDILRGDDEDALAIATSGAQGSTLTNIDLVAGLRDLLETMLGGPVTSFNAGNIILGGDGSDIIEGRGGDDLIDGDKFLNVRISVRQNPDGTGAEIATFDRAADLVSAMVNGTYNPGQLVIVREILDSAGPDFDTATFRGNRADYTFTIDDNGTALDFSDDVITVTDSVAGRDGTDTLMNIERLRFADQSIVLSGLNSGPEGLLQILDNASLTPDNTPEENQTLRVSIAGVTDADNPGGAITGPIVYYWQFEPDPDTGEFEDIILPGGGEEARATGLTFTPGDDLVGLRIRVKAVYQDANGVLEEVFSAPTVAVANVNDPPVGFVQLSDLTPAEDAFITATPFITDADGMTTALFTYQWQHFDEDLVDWVDIAGANFEFFRPDQEQVGRQVRVVVSYTDDQGTLESVASAATAAVTNTNDLPLGGVLIFDANGLPDNSPTETQTLTAVADFIDQDGISGPLAFQWQAFDGTDWVDIAGATTETFTPTQAQVNQELRVAVTYTDDFGAVETVTSDPTIVTGDFIQGTAAAEVLDGTEGQDIINGGGGADTLNGGGEDDILNGENGADTLNGGDGNDTLNGGNGNDIVNGGAGNDLIIFQVGEETDTIDGGEDIDTLEYRGTAGNNIARFLFDGSAITAIAGGTVANVEVFHLDLGDGNDTLSYDPTGPAITTAGVTVDLSAGFASGFGSVVGVENATGGSGDDLFIGDAGNNTFVGGAGRDTYSLANTTAGATITSGSATSAEAGTDTLSQIEDYIGSQGNDTILLNGGANLIDGQGGDDTLNGGAGNDTILGGDGNDTILYNLGNGADTVDGGADTDTLVINGAAGGQSLSVVFDGTRLTTVAGGAISNVELVTLNMQGGTDTLSYSTTTANVTVNLATGTGSGFVSIANVENVIGGSGNDVFTSGTGANIFQGGGGNDRFVATLNDGNDRFEGGAGSNTLDFSAITANAVVTAGSATSAQTGNDQLADIQNFIGGTGNDTITFGAGVNNVNGGGGNDVISTGAGNDIIFGGAGNDTISGGTGNDTMDGGAGTDVFLFTTNFGNDTIAGFDFNPGGGGGGPGQDFLRLNPALGITAANFAANVSIAQSGADTLITIGGNTITLLGVAANQINVTDFQFGP
jgi:Ca2+-binding RTX toxin-like protein